MKSYEAARVRKVEEKWEGSWEAAGYKVQKPKNHHDSLDFNAQKVF